MHVIFAVQRPNVRLGHLIRNSGEDFDSVSEQRKKLEDRFSEEYRQRPGLDAQFGYTASIYDRHASNLASHCADCLLE